MDDKTLKPITVQPHLGSSTDSRQTFLPVASEFMRPECALRFDIYHRTAKDKLELLYPKGSALPPDISDQIREESEGTVYVRGDQKLALIEHEEEVLQDVLDDKTVPIEAKCDAMQELTTSLSQLVFANPTAENIRRQQRNVFRLVDFSMHDRSAVKGLVRLAHHDYYTYTHSVNVGLYGLALAMAHFDEKEPQNLRDVVTAFFLHDIGKCRVRPDIINKPGPLDQVEWLEMKKHPSYGFTLLEREKILTPSTRTVILQHHERIDGKGYPQGLKGEEIHPYSRICTIIDAFDALTTNRTYRKAHSPFDALMIMRDELDAQFDSNIYKLFVLQLQKGRQRSDDLKSVADIPA